ncbi:TetR/AcrR family transcriptional regulator [Streptomyces sp. TRM66268-LWL]|uniref:TetR/AcrR family transcriptional regulator n=1 Tax=Streptomyces polyasparticus TaxID=2767826 RepID=A0ABR7S6H5_9ACTN|nr:TetR/AcrR family transcriptional regulator [Streptomyces polyasparticus]MBC9711090.1 TetR/AcrR family transcriptional regulator [Streptomyces polyasparticus]
MARTKAPNPEVRRRILDVSLDLFATKGFAATGVQEIVTKAGVTKGALYHYFKSKDEILFEIYGKVFGRELDSLQRIVAEGQDPERTLRAIIVDLVVHTADSTRESAVFARGGHAESPHWQAMQEQWRRYQEGFRQVIRDGQESGVFAAKASPEVVSWSVFGFTNSMHTWYRPEGRKSPAAIGDELADLVLTGLQS